jgi:hypothetical protein
MFLSLSYTIDSSSRRLDERYFGDERLGLALHHPSFFQYGQLGLVVSIEDGDVVQWVGGHDDHIRKRTGFESPDLAFHPEEFG